uniref:BHLH domain-containing protein n=2 Tax=Timema TaxID=61471 RepID=A0A7R9F3P5_9NEOP|nr:unnamed protein product [Timema bartmani]
MRILKIGSMVEYKALILEERVTKDAYLGFGVSQRENIKGLLQNASLSTKEHTSGDIDGYSHSEWGTNIRSEMKALKGAMPRRRRTRSASPHGDCGGSPNEPRPQQRNAANARERARMRVLSKAFCRLKTTLPWVPADTKLSKLDTLRLATSYIAHLRAILTDEEVQPGIHPLNLIDWVLWQGKYAMGEASVTG